MGQRTIQAMTSPILPCKKTEKIMAAQQILFFGGEHSEPFFWGGTLRTGRVFFSGACLLYCFWSFFAPVGFKNVVRNVFFPACLHVHPVVSLDCLCVPQPFRNFRLCVRSVFTLDSCCEMAAAVAGASGGSGGAGGGSDPPYPWRKPEVMDNLPPPPCRSG